MAVVLAVLGASGVHLLVNPAPSAGRTSRREPMSRRLRRWLDQAGLGGTSVAELAGSTAIAAATGAAVGLAAFGGPIGAVGTAAFVAATPLAVLRSRRTARLDAADEAWPALIEDIRVRCGAAGRSIPQALLDAGAAAPEALRDAFADARRVWHLTTDFDEATGVLTDRLASPTADAVCASLSVAHRLGGADIDRRLAELAEDRRQDLTARHEARARQAGVRFARRFVLIVPCGMALAGSALGTGRQAYATPQGQALVGIALVLLAGCWWWSGRLLRLPAAERVLR